MRRLTVVTICLLISVGCGIARAQTGGTRSPLQLGVGARDLAMGGAGIASCDYVTAVHWNPARLARTERISVMGFNTQMFDSDVSYRYAGLVIPTLDWGSFGIGITKLGVDHIEKRDASNVVLDSASESRLGLRFGYGHTFGAFDLGASFAFETHALDTYKASSTPGLDIAASRTVASPFRWCNQVSVSLVAKNIIAPSMRLVDESVKSPFELQAGFGARLLGGEGDRQALELTGSINKPENLPSHGAMGMEFCLMDMLRLRGSVEPGRWSAGAGLAYGGISVDYALVDRELGTLHMVSLTTSFGKSVEDLRSDRAAKRQANFNRLMSDQLMKKNSDRARQVLQAGKTALDQGDLTTAEANFDRALFLARSSELDTTEYVGLLAQVRDQIQTTDRAIRMAELLDSARARLAVLDYLGCRYFSGQALTVDSSSAEARELQSQAASATEEEVRRQEFVRDHVWRIDSLLSYGSYAEALAASQVLYSLAADNPQVQAARRKAEFEFFKAEGEMEFASRDFLRARALFDSALVRFPGQTRCLELRQACVAELKHAQLPVVEPVVEKQVLSREVQKQVERQYEVAQTAFGKGDLVAAIAAWEEVERLAPGYQSVREYLLKTYRFVGVDLYGQNRLPEALAIWVKALKIAPSNSEIAAYERRTRNEIEKLKGLSYDN